MNIDENYFTTTDNMKQNSVEDILAKNEKILARLKPNKKALLWESILKGLPLTLVWIAFDVTFIVVMALTGAFQEQPEILGFIIPFFALHLLPAWLYIGRIIKTFAAYKNIEYVFTNNRIIIRSGFIGIDFKSIYYSDVETINLKVGIIERIFKVGDIYITAKGQAAVLNNIDNPYFFLNKLQKITFDIKTDIIFPNNLRPKENDGYKTDYTQK